MGFPIEARDEVNRALLLEVYEALKNAIDNYQDFESIGKETVYWIRWYEEHKI